MSEPDVRKLFAYNATTADLFDMLCGEQIGFGISRTVYDCKLVAGCVVKVEYAKYWQNIYEWQAWKAIRDTELSKWFAPCVHISPCGSFLIQRKTKDLKQYPAKVPAFFSDIKAANWGSYKGHPVCHDYGCNLLLEKGMTGRMRKAMW